MSNGDNSRVTTSAQVPLWSERVSAWFAVLLAVMGGLVGMFLTIADFAIFHHCR